MSLSLQFSVIAKIKLSKNEKHHTSNPHLMAFRIVMVFYIKKIVNKKGRGWEEDLHFSWFKFKIELKSWTFKKTVRKLLNLNQENFFAQHGPAMPAHSWQRYTPRSRTSFSFFSYLSLLFSWFTFKIELK